MADRRSLLEIIRQCPVNGVVGDITRTDQCPGRRSFPRWATLSLGTHSVPAAHGVRLFGDRAHRLNKQFWLNEDTLPGEVRLCILVEGSLALELAATWIRDYTVDEIVQIVTADLANLQADLRDLPARHRK
ncbi:MAG: hypothetical protein H6651_14700 [Ardenticatenales bacterium]|nr:hypothetical protein [Ardenticatenales bacterium]